MAHAYATDAKYTCAYFDDVTKVPLGDPWWNVKQSCLDGDQPDGFGTWVYQNPTTPTTTTSTSTNTGDIQSALDELRREVKDILDKIGTVISQLSGLSAAQLKSVYDAVSTVNTNLVSGFKTLQSNLEIVQDNLSNQMTDGFNTISSQIAEGNTTISDQIADVGNKLDNHLDTIQSDISGISSDVETAVAKALADAFDPLVNATKRIADVEDNRLSEVRDRIKDVSDGIKNLTDSLHNDHIFEMKQLHDDIVNLGNTLNFGMTSEGNTIAGAELAAAQEIAAAIASGFAGLDITNTAVGAKDVAQKVASTALMLEKFAPLLEAAGLLAAFLPLTNASIEADLANLLSGPMADLLKVFYDIGGEMADKLGITE